MRCFARVLLAVTLSALVVLVPTAAFAHPFGPPQTIRVEGSANRVQVTWRFGATDDIAYLAVALGVLPAERATLDGAVFYEDGDADLLAGAEEFHTYLTDHLTVTAGGEPCPAEVGATDDLVDDGIPVDYACSADGAIEVSSDMLLDQHPAYRTLATGPDGQKAVYDADHTTHRWTLEDGRAGSATSAASAGAAVQLTAVTGALVALGVGGWLWTRRRAATQRR